MAKVHKIVLYIADYNDRYQDENNLKDAIECFSDREDTIIHIAEQKQSKYFEFEDDLNINKTEATTEDFKKYFGVEDCGADLDDFNEDYTNGGYWMKDSMWDE